MDSTTASSFAPLEYYKKLTNCLANRKNLKLNLSKIPGAKNVNKKNVFTNYKIQSKFLAKYNNSKRQTNEKPLTGTKDAIFNIKRHDIGKRKKEDELSYINLPDSFFKQHKPPDDWSLFKVPAVPPVKKQRSDFTNSNITLASLFSGNFNPQQFSTPLDVVKTTRKEKQLSMPIVPEEMIFSTPVGMQALRQEKRFSTPIVREEPKPIIADPSEILGWFYETQKVDEAAEILRIEKEKAEKLKALRDDINRYRKYVNDTSVAGSHTNFVYFDEADPTEDILQRLNSKYEDATQTPRESMISISKGINFETPKNEIKKTMKSWPVPEFNEPDTTFIQPYEDSEPEDDAYYESLFDFTKDIFGFLEQDDDDFQYPFTPPRSKINRKIESPASTFFFDTPNIWSSSSTNSFFVAPEGMSFSPFPYDDKPKYTSKHKEDLDWLGEAFESKMDMSWETISNTKYEDEKLRSDESAIFRSPPKYSFGDMFSRTIARPKKKLLDTKQELDKLFGCNSNEDVSWWDTKPVKSNTSFFDHTSNIFDNTFNLF